LVASFFQLPHQAISVRKGQTPKRTGSGYGNHSGLTWLEDTMTALNVRYVTFQNDPEKYARPLRAADRRRIGLARAGRAWPGRENGKFRTRFRAAIESFVAVN
jgi:hypothetical protein